MREIRQSSGDISPKIISISNIRGDKRGYSYQYEEIAKDNSRKPVGDKDLNGNDNFRLI